MEVIDKKIIYFSLFSCEAVPSANYQIFSSFTVLGSRLSLKRLIVSGIQYLKYLQTEEMIHLRNLIQSTVKTNSTTLKHLSVPDFLI